MKFLVICTLLFSTLFAAGVTDADKYNRNSDLQYEGAMESINKFVWMGSERVLDIGCGDGKITKKLTEKVPSGLVVGLDISPKMISFASSNFKAPNLLFMEGGALDLPFKEQFDVVVSFSTLHWVVDQKRALEKIRESLVPGGKALLVLPGACPNNISTQAEHLARSKKWAPYFQSFPVQRVYFTKSEYEALIGHSGLILDMITIKPMPGNYADKNALIDWLKPIVPGIATLPEKMKSEFISDLADQLIKANPPAQNGTISITHMKMEVLATKPF